MHLASNHVPPADAKGRAAEARCFPTALANRDQAFGLPPSDVLAGQRRDWEQVEKK
jgi:hypothetical protein